jgi:galactose-1-phosphate uridylyltransferase
VADLARVLKRLTGLLVKAIGDPSYRLTLHTAPNLSVKIVQGEWDTIERDYHWHLEILVYPERAMWVAGIAVTDMLPEEAARILREAGSLEPSGG